MSIIVSTKQKPNSKSPRFTEEDKNFASATFEAFAPYISHTCWGINKRHTITKAEFVAFNKWCDERNRGVEKPRIVILDEQGEPWLNADGEQIFFNYYWNYKRNLWTPDAIPACINGEELHYYMSPARAGEKLPYLDLDAHKEWQDDLDDAIALIKELFGDKPFYRYSHGGYNGWLKVGDAPSAKEYNAGLARMERVLRDVFAQCRIKTSIEVKGRSVWGELKSFDDRRSHLAKLPYWNHRFPCHRKDADDKWSYPRLDEFKNKPDIRWKSLMAGIDELKQKLDPVKVEEGRRYLQSLKDDTPIVVHQDPQAVHAEERIEEPVDETLSPRSQADACEMPPPRAVDMYGSPAASASQPRPESLEEIRQISDAFVRNREFALYASRLARRPLTAEELLEQDRQHHIYNGQWEEGLAERKRRYRQIAPFVARTFDPAKCGSRESERPTLDENLRRWRGRAYRFSKVAIGYVGKRAKKVDRQVLIGLTAIIQTVSKPNGDCPRDSIQGWWEELAAEDKMPAWNVDLYTAARSVLARRKIIVIDHKRYQFVPDTKGRCKGIWIREQETVGERNYRYPSPPLYSLFVLLPLHKGYDVDINQENGWFSQIGETRPPP